MNYKTIRASQAVLDSENPRLPDGTSSEKEAINRLLAEGAAQLMALAKDLIERGEANPTELPIVLALGSKYVVLEGNRRFAALKLLGDPLLADDPAHQLAFTRLTRTGRTPPKSIYCAVFNDRAAADHWITLRHTGANDGVGVRGWSAEQNARHRQRMKAPIDTGTRRAITFADELTEAYQADSELVALIEKVRSERLTNIGRYFSGVTLTRMQFRLVSSEDGTQILLAKHTSRQLRSYFLRAFEYLDTHSVDAFKNNPLRDNLLNANADVIPSAGDSLPDYQRLADSPHIITGTVDPSLSATEPVQESELARSDVNSSDGSAGGGTPIEENGSNASVSGGDSTNLEMSGDQEPEKSLYSAVALPNLSASVQRLLKEAQQLRIDRHYATACVLARVILELAVSDPKVLGWSGAKEASPLVTKIRACIVKLDPQIDKPKQRIRPDLVQAHLETESMGVAYLHQFMHNATARADPHLARRFSTIYTPLLHAINESIAG